MPMQLEFFSEHRIALNQEVLQHPELQALLGTHPVDAFEERLGEVAAYCGIIVDGYYTQEDIDKLCGILVRKLRDKRSIIILPDSLG